MGDFKKKWYVLVVIPSGEPFGLIHIYIYIFKTAHKPYLISEYKLT